MSDSSDSESGSIPPIQEPETSLRPTLEGRHVDAIGFNAVLGIGLFLGAGKVVAQCGPGLALIVFLVTGLLMWSIMGCIGEPTALYPVNGPNFEFISRFLDVSVGYAAGWFLLFSWAGIIVIEIVAITNLFKFRVDPTYLAQHGYPPEEQTLRWWWADENDDPSPACWIVLSLAIILLLNCLPVRWYAEIEYGFACLKICFVVAIIMINVILNSQRRYHDHPFWTWNLGFKSASFTIQPATETEQPWVIGGSLGALASFWTGVTTAFFSMLGWDITILTAPENKDLDKAETVKLSGRKIGLRVVVLYVLSVFAVSLNVPYNDEKLQSLLGSYDMGRAETSIFVLAAIREHIPRFSHVLVGFFIFSAVATASNSLYSASRILHALASTPEAWPWFLEGFRRKLQRTRWGVPHRAVVTSWVFGFLSFIALESPETGARALGGITAAWSTAILIVYALNCLAYLNFYKEIKAIAAGNIDRICAQIIMPDDRIHWDRNATRYPWKTHGQWLRAVFGGFFCSLLILFYGWHTFLPPFSTGDFVATYINIPGFLVIAGTYFFSTRGFRPSGWKLQRSKFVGIESFHVKVRAPEKCKICHKRHRLGEVVWPKDKLTWPKGYMTRAKVIAEWVWFWLR
ncbi:amino acid permease-domain-containing protein [Podospora australis]|uniref:Amino acid permease-domain-containing protein n=1 Tax=Podospora australis TaxID=1536484 RepID=A0AAN6WND4_9PEZI|nr:amino acid permease-domain-containing protein [Podospora australis]